MARSPARSTATLGMNRKNVFAPSGSYDLPWTVFGATVPPVTFAWYQRPVALPVVPALQVVFVALSPRRTVCATQSDSAPARFEYWACAIARIASVSAELAGVDAAGTSAFGQQVGASCVSGPVNVDVETLSQSTFSL